MRRKRYTNFLGLIVWMGVKFGRISYWCWRRKLEKRLLFGGASGRVSDHYLVVGRGKSGRVDRVSSKRERTKQFNV